MGVTVRGPVPVGSEKPHLISPDHWNLISLFYLLVVFPLMWGLIFKSHCSHFLSHTVFFIFFSSTKVGSKFLSPPTCPLSLLQAEGVSGFSLNTVKR